MQRFPSVSLDGTYEMAVVMQKEYAGLQMEISHMHHLKEVGIETFPAVVPGNFELDLERNGKIPNPFYASNILELQKFEYAHVFYSKTFRYSPDQNSTPVLLMEGVDTYADIYLNGEMIAPYRKHVDSSLYQCIFYPGRGKRTVRTYLSYLP